MKIDRKKIKYKSPPLWGGKPLFKSFDKHNCQKCGKEYLETNLISQKNYPFYFCIRCHNRKNSEKI